MWSISKLMARAVVAALPTSLALVAPLGTTSAAPRPVTSHMVSQPLLTLSAVPSARGLSAADAAEARRRAGGRPVSIRAASRAVTLPAGVAVLGVTWSGSTRGPSVQYRELVRGSWGGWTFIDTNADHRPDAAEARTAGVRSGSDVLAVTGGPQIQVRMLAPNALNPGDVRLVVIDPGSSPADARAAQAPPGSAVAAVSQPTIYSRAQWGADESLRRGPPSYGAVKAAFVHHTAGSNSYTSDQVPAIIRGIYAYHVNGQGWNDIGYNFLVDRFGRTWEGRYGGIARPVIGAHASGVNSFTFGVSVLGNYSTAVVPSAVSTALGRLIAWKAQVHEFSPAGRALIGSRTYATVSGHRDANQTECPGDYLYGTLATLRANSRSLTAGLPSLSLDRDLDNRNDADVVATNSAKDLLLYSSTNSNSVRGPVRLAAGTWTGRDQVHVVGDFSGDGAVDLIAREQATAKLLLYPGTGAGGIGTARVIGTGWGDFSLLVAAGDWDGDGRPDVLGRYRPDGSLRLYPGNGQGGFLAPRLVGTGWAGMRLVSGTGDWDGDGKRDLLAVTASGVGLIYRGNGSGGWSGTIRLPGNWTNLTSVVGVGDATGDTKVDVFVTTSAGTARIGRRGSTAAEILWSDPVPWATKVYSG
jgi:hypothetical protein